jgi:Na+-transporting NADH:ubiquinone oxidoreductase subunit C
MGLWDAIWGYVAVDENQIVKGIVFDHKAETPGLGGDINRDFFQDRFIGENIFSAKWGISKAKCHQSLYKGGDDKTDGKVDAISGATLTCNGVSKMLLDGLKPYENYLKTLQK